MPRGQTCLNLKLMARRNRQPKGPSLVLGLALLIVLLSGGFAVFKLAGGGSSSDFRGLTSLNVSEYLENS